MLGLRKLRRLSKYVLLLILTTLLVVGGNPTQLVSAEETMTTVYSLSLGGTVDAGLASLLRRTIAQAEDNGADVLLLRISTLGGTIDSAINMRDMLLETSLTTVAFVQHRAWSAGVLLTLACEYVIMAPGSSLGAAEPRPLEEKIISALTAELESTAAVYGRDEKIAAAMVDQRIEIPGLVNEGALLTLTANRALELGFADHMAATTEEALDRLELEPVQLINVEPTSVDRFAQWVTSPYVAPLILALGFVGLVIELFMPGFGVPGLVGLLAFVAYFVGHVTAGYAGLSIAVLFVVGMVLLISEVFIPEFGVMGISGLIAMMASIYLASPNPVTATWSIIIALAAILITALILIRMGSRIPIFQKLMLGEEQRAEQGYVAQSDVRALLGMHGKALTAMRPAGTAEINEERVDVVSGGQFIAKGATVEVVRVEGRRIVVREVEASESERSE